MFKLKKVNNKLYIDGVDMAEDRTRQIDTFADVWKLQNAKQKPKLSRDVFKPIKMPQSRSSQPSKPMNVRGIYSRATIPPINNVKRRPRNAPKRKSSVPWYQGRDGGRVILAVTQVDVRKNRANANVFMPTRRGRRRVRCAFISIHVHCSSHICSISSFRGCFKPDIPVKDLVSLILR